MTIWDARPSGEKRGKCLICGKALYGRRDKKTCSSACRKAYSRRESDAETLRSLSDAADDATMGLVLYAGAIDQATAFSAQRRLKALVIKLLSHCDEKLQREIYEQLAASVTADSHTSDRIESEER